MLFHPSVAVGPLIFPKPFHTYTECAKLMLAVHGMARRKWYGVKVRRMADTLSWRVSERVPWLSRNTPGPSTSLAHAPHADRKVVDPRSIWKIDARQRSCISSAENPSTGVLLDRSKPTSVLVHQPPPSLESYTILSLGNIPPIFLNQSWEGNKTIKHVCSCPSIQYEFHYPGLPITI